MFLNALNAWGRFYTEYRLNPDAKALLAGFCGRQPHIYSWGVAQPSPKGGDIPPWEAIGCGSDVALHYVRGCGPLVDFDIEKLSVLVYFSISEIAKSDVRVGKPIDIAVINQGGATIKHRDSIQHLEPVSEHLGTVIRNGNSGAAICC